MKQKKRLLWQLYPSYLFITIISLFAVSWFTLSSLEHFFHEQTSSDLTSRAYLFSSQIETLLSNGDYSGIDSVCKSSGEIASTRITVILPSGTVVGDSEKTPSQMEYHGNRPEIVKALSGKKGSSIRFSKTLNLNMMYVAVPIIPENDISAVLRTAVPVSSIEEELKSIQIKIAAGGLFVAIIAAIISLIISRRVSRPIEELKRGAEHFESGDLDYRLFVPDSAEIGGLAEAMNKMALQLDDRIKTVVRQKNELEAVFSGMDEGVIAIDNDQTIISINHAATLIFGDRNSDIHGRTITDIIRNIEFLDFVKLAADSFKTLESDITLHDLDNRTLNTRTSPLYDAENSRTGTLIVFNDVTKMRRLETMRKDFASNVSHEIKTPLTSIKGFVETLLTSPGHLHDEAVHFLTIIEKNVNRLMLIIEDLLQLSKIENENDRILRFTDETIVSVIDTAIQLCSIEAGKKTITIDTYYSEDFIVAVDRSLFEQATVNLIDNAIKYSNEGSTISIKVSNVKDRLDIAVSDKGIGICKEHLPRLFERFYRVDRARSRKLGGTGLGLAIVKHIMLAHDGDVSVESTPGKGSTFTLHLPMVLSRNS